MAEEKKETLEEPTTTPSPIQENDSKKKKVIRIVSVVVGILCMVAGFFSFCDSDELNNALIEVGAGQSVSNIVAEYPKAAPYASKIIDVIEAAIEARTSDPERLTTMIVEAIGKDAYTVPGLQSLLHLIVATINKQYDSSKTEDEYIDKLRHLVTGIRDGLNVAAAEVTTK